MATGPSLVSMTRRWPRPAWGCISPSAAAAGARSAPASFTAASTASAFCTRWRPGAPRRKVTLSPRMSAVAFEPSGVRSAESSLASADLTPEGSKATADILGDNVTFRLGAPGRHLVQNALAVLAAVKLAGADLAPAAAALGEMQPQAGRGQRRVIETKEGPVAIVDESYNANPASMRAALSTLGLAPRSVYKRRVAVLGDMLELGPEGPKLHQELAQDVDGAGVDVVFACGELMASLFQALPAGRQGAYAKSSGELEPKLLEGVGPGDIIMIKGSLGSRMAPLVEALRRRFEAESVSA